jgi:hypothetical protein
MSTVSLRTLKRATKFIFGWDLNVCDDGILLQVLSFWILSIVLSIFQKTKLFGDWILSPSSGKTEIGASPIYWIQLSRFYLRTETESSLRNVVFFKKWTRRWIISKNLILVRSNSNLKSSGLWNIHNIVQSGESQMKFWKNMSPSSAGWKCESVKYQHEAGREFRVARSSTLKTEAKFSSGTSFDFHRTTWRYIPESTTLHNHRCGNPRSYIIWVCTHAR